MAAYKFNTLAEQTIEWVSAISGKTFRVTVALREETMDYFGTGEFQRTRDGLQIAYRAYIDGVQTGAVYGPEKLAQPQGVAVARIGTIGMPQAQYDAVLAAEDAIKQHPEWQAKLVAIEAGHQVAREYEAHAKAVDSMMTLGGKSY